MHPVCWTAPVVDFRCQIDPSDRPTPTAQHKPVSIRDVPHSARTDPREASSYHRRRRVPSLGMPGLNQAPASAII
jgi:hypothetical protein